MNTVLPAFIASRFSSHVSSSMNTVSGALRRRLRRRRGIHRRLERRGLRRRCAAAARAAAPPPPPPCGACAAATGGSPPAFMRLICASAISILICSSALPTSGVDFAWLLPLTPLFSIVVAGQAIAANVLRRDEQQLGGVEDVGVVADLVVGDLQELRGPGVLLGVRLGVVVVDPVRGRRAVPQRVQLLGRGAHAGAVAAGFADEPDLLEAAGLEAAAGADEQLDESIFRQRDRAGLAPCGRRCCPSCPRARRSRPARPASCPSPRAILSAVYSMTNLCSPSTMCGPFCSVPAVPTITLVVPAAIRSRTSAHVRSSMKTESGGLPDGAVAGASAGRCAKAPRRGRERQIVAIVRASSCAEGTIFHALNLA